MKAKESPWVGMAKRLESWHRGYALQLWRELSSVGVLVPHLRKLISGHCVPASSSVKWEDYCESQV